MMTHTKHETSRTAGFTLIELMVVVAIIGILAAVAIPSFINYQLTAKRAEAYANLAALAKSQKSYYAEFNGFVYVVAEPSGALGGPGPEKRDEASVKVAFEDVGWMPEGQVFYDYDTNTPDGTGTGADCTCVAACFTAAAYGDLDGDGNLSVLLYAQPDSSGNWCSTSLAGNLDPPQNAAGQVQWNMVSRVILADLF